MIDSRCVRKRLVFLCALILFLTVSVIVAIWLVCRQSDINLGGYEKIQIGMEKQQVEQILGGPPGEYLRAKAVPFDENCYVRADWDGKNDCGQLPSTDWTSDEAHISVWFDCQDKVAMLAIRSHVRPQASLWERLQALMHIQ
jgi:hypothetical protein